MGPLAMAQRGDGIALWHYTHVGMLPVDLKGEPMRTINWPETVESAKIFASLGCSVNIYTVNRWKFGVKRRKCVNICITWFICHYLYSKQKKYFFCFEVELLMAHGCWFALYQPRAEKGRHMTYLILLPHIPAVFMTSLIQTSGHIMTALAVLFSRLFKSRFLATRTRY